MASYLRAAAIVHLPFRNPPGFLSVEDQARLMRGETPPRSYTKDRRVIDMRNGSVQELIDAGILFCGTPDQVYAQIVDFCEYCGGMGNLLMMGHAGSMSHADTVENLTLFARRGLPAAQGVQAAGRDGDWRREGSPMELRPRVIRGGRGRQSRIPR